MSRKHKRGAAHKAKGKAGRKDPHAAREAAKYDKPIPSREFILSLLSDAGQLLTAELIFDALKLKDDQDFNALHRYPC